MKKRKLTRQTHKRKNSPPAPQQVSAPLRQEHETEEEVSVKHVLSSPFFRSLTLSIGNGWLSNGKRFTALRHVSERVDLDALDALPPITIYAPRIEVAGCVHLRNVVGQLVYLSPTLELESQKRVDFTVAHEIAHLVLGHHVPGDEQGLQQAYRYESDPAEIAANKLAEMWGFKNMKRLGVFDNWIMKDSSMTTKKHVYQLITGWQL